MAFRRSPSRPLSSSCILFSSPYNDEDVNKWINYDAEQLGNNFNADEDWEETLAKRQDGTAWGTSFESSDSDEDIPGANQDEQEDNNNPLLDDGEAWLDTLQSISADEVSFNIRENERADTARQMMEWGFESEQIEAALDVNMNETVTEEEQIIDDFRRVTAESGFGMMVEDDVDLATVESHTMVEKDEETGEPIRTQMVYVDEHSCIGCTNCAMIAGSTFFMEEYLGRARVFNQWGDDDETIAVAIETCPVDCIHYVPYEELVSLEVTRRNQNINFKARLVNQGEYGGGTGHLVGGGNGFTDAPEISGNMGTRCNNCPSRGCKNCPMYGVGKNPYFEKKEEERQKKKEARERKRAMEAANKRLDL